ncbi:MAG TPA: cell division protein FtsZ, partial [Solirubrobacteraceae bacterium]|nr:cell division protein FtsZ [Solirubrobacteraceae bacterium]
MREGPLAALFRRTDEAAEEAEAAARAAEESAVPAARPQDPRALRHEEERARRGPQAESLPQPTTPAAERAAERAARERGYPHPSLGAAAPPEEAQEPAPRIPTPQERLRHAFSSDLPEDILERPAPPPPAPPAAHAGSDPYAARGIGDEQAWGHARATAGPVIRVVGVGGAGVNAVNRMVEAEIAGVDFVGINTDLQSLQQSSADVTIHIGPQVTRGLGAGSNPDLGRQAAMEEYDRIKAHLKGSDMVFIAAGAGGGTGTGAAPIVARISREIGALTVGIITKPFGFEGNRRDQTAAAGIEALRDEVDTLIVVPNNRLLSVLDKQTSMVDAFRVADDVLRQGVQGVSDLVTLPGLINLDFADVRTIMSEAGNALLGIGMGVGEHRATQAAQQAVASPLLETSMEGAHKILLSITGGESLSLWEVNEAAKAVAAAAHPDANIIFGAMVDEKLDDQVWVTVVATGYDGEGARAPRRPLREPAGEPRVERRTPPSARG